MYGHVAHLPQFLYEMTFSENALIALQNTGLKGEELAIHYYQNYEDERMQWFTSAEESHAESLIEAAPALLRELQHLSNIESCSYLLRHVFPIL